MAHASRRELGFVHGSSSKRLLGRIPEAAISVK